MIAAPFLGEFGWLVALWVPWLRGMRKHYEYKDEFIVYCQKGHRVFFEDFASTVVEIDRPLGITKIDCQLAWLYGVKMRREDYLDVVSHTIGEWRISNNKLITPLDMKYSWPPNRPPLPTKRAVYRKFGDSKVDEKLIAFHARYCEEKQPERDWPLEHWVDLSERLEADGYKTCSIGSKSNSLWVSGSEDMTGLPTKEEVEILSACKFIIGPSSGPLHLANHCGTPAVWWGGGDKNLERYTVAWNPYNVRNRCVTTKSWQPTPEQVYRYVCLTQSSSPA